MLKIGERHVGTNAFLLDGHDVFSRPIFGIPGDLAGSQLPPKAHPPEQIEHRLVVHHFGGRDQGLENNA